MEAKPLRSVPSSHNTTSGKGSGPQKKKNCVVVVGDEEKKRVVDVVVKEENGVGVGVFHTEPKPEAINNTLIKVPRYYHKCCLFTEAQRRELYHQVLIFNHFACNLSLYHHHLVAAFPSSISGYSSQGFDCGSLLMDPEPHRCRRTDGKKWRCSRNVMPDQKYCERHMHRGCNRSRKHVETSQVNSPLTINPSSGKLQTKLTSSNAESAVSNPNPLGTKPIKTSSCAPSRSQCVVNTLLTNNRLKNIIGSADYHTSFSPTTAIALMATTFNDSTSAASHNRSGLLICKKENQTKSCVSSNIGVKSGGKGSIIYDGNGIISTGIGFSARSVLQGNIVVPGCDNSYLNPRSSVELEPGRCRRTDGKKWRCKSAVIPGQKYCATHMHRGSKRRFTEHEPAATDSAVTIAQLTCSTATTNIQKAYCSISNTKLSMSIPARQCH